MRISNSELQEALEALDREILAGLDKLRNIRADVLTLQAAARKGQPDPTSDDYGMPLVDLQRRTILLTRRAGAFSMLSSSLYKTVEGLLTSIPGARDIVSENDFENFFGTVRRAMRQLIRILWSSRKIVVE